MENKYEDWLLTDELDLYLRRQNETSKLLFKRLVEARKDHADAIALAGKAEQELDTLRKQNEWVSVKDRLPNESGYYQVTHARFYGKSFKQIVTSTFFDSDRPSKAHAWAKKRLPDTNGMPVTHWRALPSPPTKE